MSANALNGLERVARGNSAAQLTRDMGHLRLSGGMARCRSRDLEPASPNEALAPQKDWIADAPLIAMARATGLEPAASGVTGRRSNQLSYARINKVRLLSALCRPPGLRVNTDQVKRVERFD